MIKNQKFDLSIIIVSYNTQKLTKECIHSIKVAKPKLKYEIIVVDNGSTDGSIEMIKRHPEFSLGSKGILKLVQNDKNLGFAKASNKGLKISKGKYKLLLNSDTIVKKGALDKMVDFAEKTKEAGVVGPKLILKDDSIQKSCFNFPTIINAIQEYWFGINGSYSSFVPKRNKPVEVDAIVGAAFLITPKAFEEIGFLNEKYFMYFEDLDYCREVYRAGLKTYYLPSVEIKHHHGASGKKMRRDEVYQMLSSSSKNYHGKCRYHIIQFILWSWQKAKKLGFDRGSVKH